MSLLRPLFAFALFGSVAVASPAWSANSVVHEGEPVDAPAPSACLKSWGETRARAYGYDHFVVIDNGCAKVAACVVSADVNPEPQTVSVPAKTRVEVSVYLGSPAYTFTPKVECKLQ